MTPEQIKTYVEVEYGEKLQAEPRSNPDGYAFYLMPKRGGSDSNRIFRAVTSDPGGPTMLKLAISSRMNRPDAERIFNGNTDDLCKLIDAEIDLYTQNFDA